MKRVRSLGEGWLILATLVGLLALSGILWLDRQPRTQFAAPVHSVSMEALERAATIDVNAASAKELEQLPGIGPVLAEAIVEYREANGSFERAEDLMNVYGIGPAKLEAMLPFLRLD